MTDKNPPIKEEDWSLLDTGDVFVFIDEPSGLEEDAALLVARHETVKDAIGHIRALMWAGAYSNPLTKMTIVDDTKGERDARKV